MKKGFTLIELMVVVAIIAILTAILTANFTAAKSKSRDAKRISDLSQIQLALAGYFDRCNAYPTTLTDSTYCANAGSNNINLASFISTIPTPPTANEYYYYTVDATNGYDDYFLGATLENNGSLSNNSLIFTSSPNTYPSWYVSPYTGLSATTPSGGTIAAPLPCNSLKNYCIGPK